MIRIKQCSLADLDALMNLQKRCFAALKNKDWLRNNSEENFRVCLQTPNFALGLFSEEQLIAVAILQICGLDSENLDGPGEHPWMEAQETILLAPFELQVLHIS